MTLIELQTETEFLNIFRNYLHFVQAIRVRQIENNAELENIILKSVAEHLWTKEISEYLSQRYQFPKKELNTISTDLLGRANAAKNAFEQRNNPGYIWVCMDDELTRASHKSVNGK